jgi:hypothetical protein
MLWASTTTEVRNHDSEQLLRASPPKQVLCKRVTSQNMIHIKSRLGSTSRSIVFVTSLSSSLRGNYRLQDCLQKEIKTAKTYNSRDSLMVTHLTTNPPVSCLNRAERTGSLVVSCSIVTLTAKYPVFGFVLSVNRYLAPRGCS